MKHRLYDGLSLLETLMALLILSILFAFGMSNLLNSYSKNQDEVIAKDILQAIQFAKMQALTHGKTVTLAPIEKDGDWSQGMRLLTHDKLVIREWQWHHFGNHQVRWRGFESLNYLRFTPDLLSRSANGQFVIQHDAKHQIKVVVNRLARARMISNSH